LDYFGPRNVGESLRQDRYRPSDNDRAD
jgi:hypothetical protein